ncbi:TPA: phage tail protein [Escherichia coli]|uniref:phage tail protein n=1 Tax=Escherichia coli TaxID=562 RepID=UPI000942F3C5|nr:phage tail protein [Escherichia coli]EFD0040183.1 phage tail protein [Escherichia coli]HAX3305845.1 phage tail protein [Escherichia coli]HAX3315398.1 phage tail protein [Escherichia coli]HCB8161517.1 phage tail protein [Escherichia coli]
MNTAEVRKIVTRALSDATGAGWKVYSPRTLPVMPDQYPLVIVSVQSEHKVSQGRHVPQYTTTTTLRIDGRVLAYASGDDTESAAGVAWEEAEAMKEALERAIIGNPDVRMKFQQIADIRAHIGVDSEGEGHAGIVVLELDLEYYQGPEDFFPSEIVPLREVNVRGVHPPLHLHFDLPAGDETGSET